VAIGSTLRAAVRRARLDWRRASTVIVLQALLTLVAVRAPGIDQFPGVLVIAAAIAGSYCAGALVGGLGLVPGVVLFLVLKPGVAPMVTTGGILSAFAVAAVAGLGVSRAFERERLSRRGEAEERERYRNLLDMTFDAIVLSADGLIVDANAGFERLSGLAREEAGGRALLDFVAPESLDAAREMMATRASGPIELRAFDAAGRLRTVTVVSHDVTHRGRPARLSAIKDITLERKAEQERQAVELRFRALFESAAIAVTLATIDGVYLEANDVYCELVGRSRDEVVGRHFSEFVSPGEGGDPEVLDGILAGDPGPFRFEGAMLDAAGARVPVRVTVSLVRDADGAPLYTVAILESIAAQRRLEAQMRQQQKMEAIGQLAGGIAHDFNNLLTVIGGNVLLAGMSDLPEDARAHVAEISAAADRAATLTRQLLTFSRAQEPELGDIDLNRLVAGLEDMLARLIGSDVVVDTLLEPALPHVLADPVQLELVLINLAANARDAMPEGGRLTIRTEQAGESVCLSVADTGTGMDEATRERVFEPFFTTKRAGEGTGLGLANVYGIVLRAGGEIEVESELGRGTTFRVTLPAVEPSQVALPLDDEDVEELDLPTGCILFVDDEPSVRRIAGVALSRAGHDPMLAASGEEALALLASGRSVDLLVTDVVMPGMNGIELAERVRADRPGMAILFVSGYADRVIDAYGGDAEIEVLDKPFTPSALAERVARALAGS
jgi:two-component system, cell cycle sensor histidine kinase and response regulator CckA